MFASCYRSICQDGIFLSLTVILRLITMSSMCKICYRIPKDCALCCETPEDRVFACGHRKKVVISWRTLTVLFYYFWWKRRETLVKNKFAHRSTCQYLSLFFLSFSVHLSHCTAAELRRGHEAALAAAGYGLFIRTADCSMAEAQQEVAAAAKGYWSSPSSPSSMSPTPSPPPAAAVHGGGGAEDAAAAAIATPAARSLGAGDSGSMQVSGHGEHAGLSSRRRRGRPKGSGRRQILANLGEWYALSAGGSFTPHVIIVATGEDVAARIMSFSQKGPRSVCILAANGTISNVVLNQPGSSGSTFSYEV
jgi:hypothetical protein